MRYTVDKISRHSGLSPQTIRNYADAGMLSYTVDEKNRYRYFDADAVNRASAVRRLKMMDFPMEDVRLLIKGQTPEQFDRLMDEQIARNEREITRRLEVLEILRENRDGLRRALQLGEGMLIEEAGPYYCLDYRRGNELLLTGSENLNLLNAWMDQALYTRNYTPLPTILDEQRSPEHVVGLLIDARHAAHVPIEGPVYRRERSLCAIFALHHDERMTPLPKEAGFYRKKLDAAGVEACAEAFLIGSIPVCIDGRKRFVTTLYIPVRRR